MSEDLFELDFKKFKIVKKTNNTKPNHPLYNKKYYLELSYKYNVYPILSPVYKSFDINKAFGDIII